MVTCPKCGYDNELGRIFCHSCGTKLNLEDIRAPSQGGKSLKKKSSGGSKKTVRRVIDVLVLAAVVAVIALALQVPWVRPISTTNEDLVSANKKRLALDELTTYRTATVIAVSETELNAFMDTVSMSAGKREGVTLTPSKMQLELGDGTITAILVSKLSFSGKFEKGLYVSCRGVPAIEGGHFVFKTTGGTVGGLPVHPWLLEKSGLLRKCFGSTFAKLAPEKQGLDALTSISVTPKEAVLTYQPH